MSRPMALETDPDVWRSDALAYVESRARAGHIVTADDVRRDLPEPHHPNAVGGIFLSLSRRGVIVKAGDHPATTKSRRHGHSYAWTLNPEARD